MSVVHDSKSVLNLFMSLPENICLGVWQTVNKKEMRVCNTCELNSPLFVHHVG